MHHVVISAAVSVIVYLYTVHDISCTQYNGNTVTHAVIQEEFQDVLCHCANHSHSLADWNEVWYRTTHCSWIRCMHKHSNACAH